MRGHLAVVGAGIVGVCCALHLQRAGFRVTLLDRAAAGEGCSYGNGGLLQTGGCVPLGSPAVLRQLPRMLLDPLSPMRVRWTDLPWLSPFLARFVLASLPGRFEEIADALATLLRHAWAGYEPLLQSSQGQSLVRRSGELYVYETDASFASALKYHQMRAESGVCVRYLDGEGARAIEPSLGQSVRHAAWLPETRATTDPLQLTLHLLRAFAAAGGQVLRAEVQALEVSSGQVVGLRLEDGCMRVDAVVVAAGTQSPHLLEPLGVSVPLRPERGHHLMLDYAGPNPRTPIVSGDHRFGLIPMGGRIRLVGSSELTRQERPPDYSRIERLLAPAARLLPGLSLHYASRWYGARPSMPDSLPVIGRCPGWDNVLLAFGHGHLGLTLAGVTGQLVTQLAEGTHPSVELASFGWPRPSAASRRRARGRRDSNTGRTIA